MINIEALKKIATITNFKAGTIIITEKSNVKNDIYFLLSGKVGIFQSAENATQVQLSTLSEGSIFGELSAFTKEPSITTAMALSDVTVAAVTDDKFVEFIIDKPINTLELIISLCYRLTDINKKYVELAANEKIRKQAEALAKPQNGPSENYGQLFPKAHKSYTKAMPKVYNDFMIDVPIICPCCGAAFSGKKILTTKLRGSDTQMGCDMRMHNKDFDIIWNNITTCPGCYFSAFSDYFVNKKLFDEKKEIKQKLRALKSGGLTIMPYEYRTMDTVFAVHYLALISAGNLLNEKQVTAKLWLQLTYLYSDANDEAMYRVAVSNALEAYTNLYSNSRMSSENEQMCCLILAHLCMEIKDYIRALNYLNTVRQAKDAKLIYKKIADDKIQDWREIRKR